MDTGNDESAVDRAGAIDTSTVQAFIVALEAQDWDQATSYLNNDFTFSGMTPRQLDREQFLLLMKLLKTSMPDWAFHLHDVRQEQGGSVNGKIQITGTHSARLVLPGGDFPPIPATGKRISLPEEEMTFMAKAGKSAAMAIRFTPDGDIPGLLEQLGVESPLPKG
jgi:hypothetical protein